MLWAPDGLSLTVLTQANHIYNVILDPKSGEIKKLENTKTTYLPLTTCVYIDKDTLVAGGYDKVLLEFKKEGRKW